MLTGQVIEEVEKQLLLGPGTPAYSHNCCLVPAVTRTAAPRQAASLSAVPGPAAPKLVVQRSTFQGQLQWGRLFIG
jgi:hypothetical protein